MNWISQTGPVSASTSSLPGLYQAAALRRFRARLAARLRSYASVGDGGVDICCIGDSNTLGYNAATRRFDNWTHLLKVALQRQFNPEGVQGGYGYAMWARGATTTNRFPGSAVNGAWNEFVGSDDASADNTSGNLIDLQGGIGGVRLALDGSATAREFRAAFQLNGGLNTRFRTQVTDCEAVYCTRSNGTTNGAFDISTGAAPGTSAGSVATQTLNTNGSNNHHVRGTMVTGMTSSADHWIQFAGGTATNTWLYANGVNLYCDDTSCGVRVHNFGQPSRRLYDIAADSARMAATVDEWGTGSGTGARYAGLYIMMSGVNEAGSGDSSVSRTASQYYDDLVAMINRVVSNTATSPSLLIVGQSPRAGTNGGGYITSPDSALFTRTSDHPEQYRQAEIAAAAIAPDIVTYLNVPEALGWQGPYTAGTFASVFSATSTLTSLGSTDGVHLSTRGHRMLADILYAVLSERV